MCFNGLLLIFAGVSGLIVAPIPSPAPSGSFSLLSNFCLPTGEFFGAISFLVFTDVGWWCSLLEKNCPEEVATAVLW